MELRTWIAIVMTVAAVGCGSQTSNDFGPATMTIGGAAVTVVSTLHAYTWTPDPNGHPAAGWQVEFLYDVHGSDSEVDGSNFDGAQDLPGVVVLQDGQQASAPVTTGVYSVYPSCGLCAPMPFPASGSVFAYVTGTTSFTASSSTTDPVSTGTVTISSSTMDRLDGTFEADQVIDDSGTTQHIAGTFSAPTL